MSDAAAVDVRGRPLIPGEGRGPLLRLTHPISFWGGVDPTSGQIVDPRHPEFGSSITGTVLAIPAAVGSSSSSAIMLELLREGTAPAAILMGKADAILALGGVVGGEVGGGSWGNGDGAIGAGGIGGCGGGGGDAISSAAT